MKEQLIVKNLPFIRILPSWAQEPPREPPSKATGPRGILYFLSHDMSGGESHSVTMHDIGTDSPPGTHRADLCGPTALAAAILAQTKRMP